jgi:translocation and assembly module TamA
MIKQILVLFRQSIVTLLFALLCLSSQAASLVVEGLQGELEKNVDVYLSSIPKEEYSISLRFQSRVEDNIKLALKALGYYEPQLEFLVDEKSDKLRVTIVAGDPVRIAERDIIIEGEATDDPDFISLLNSGTLNVGQVLNHAHYDAMKSSIRNLAMRRGYFEGDFTLSALEVSPQLNQAFVRLHYNSGIRYHFGETTIEGSQIDEERVKSLIPYENGSPYLATQIGTLNQNLSNTQWFSSVYVEPNLEQVGKGRELPITVRLAPQSQNQIETGLGVSSDVGVRGTLNWKKPWINSYGHSLDSSISLSAPEQTIVAGYKVPLEDVLNEYYRLQYGMKYLDNLDTESFEASLGLERHWQLESGWHRTAYIRFLQEDFTQGLQEDKFFMTLPGISYSKARTRGGSMPTWGDKQTLSIEVADEALLSEASLLRLQAKTAWIRSLGQNHRGIVKVDLSANITEDVANLPPSIRFFAGGDNNLRGYAYESISPTDEAGNLTGAKYMATSSLEYQYRVYGDWWLAAFMDAGDAFNDEFVLKRGTGLGLRWASPVGPIRLDFAFGLEAEEGDQFQFHFGLGPEL